MVHYETYDDIILLVKKTANIKIKKNKTLWPCFIIDQGEVTDIKKQILNFILIDTKILLVKFDKGQL